MYKKVAFFLIGISLAAAGVVHAATIVRSPSACSTSDWGTCSNAFSSNNLYATSTGTGTGVWSNYGFSFASTSSSTVLAVSVGVEAKVGSCPPGGSITVNVSQDGGTNYGAGHVVNLNCTDSTTWVNVTADFPSWTQSHLNDSNLRVKATCGAGAFCYLDWLPVEVTTL